MHLRKALTGILVAIVAMLLLAGCASPDKPVTTESDFKGFITGVNAVDNDNVIGSIAVESHAGKLVDKYVVTITNDTKLLHLIDGDYQDISFEDLEEKQWVEIWFDGPVAESWPMQAKALQVVITP